MKKRRFVLTFPSDVLDEPIIYNLIKDFDVKINIINANITPGKEGQLLIEFQGGNGNIDKSLAYVEKKGIATMPIGKELLWNQDECVHCGSCSGVCFSGALHLDRGNWKMQYDAEKCTVCGFCIKACPFGLFELDFGAYGKKI